jgi:hypothetical protein
VRQHRRVRDADLCKPGVPTSIASCVSERNMQNEPNFCSHQQALTETRFLRVIESTDNATQDTRRQIALPHSCFCGGETIYGTMLPFLLLRNLDRR